MFVQNHHSLEELQRLTKALTKKRIGSSVLKCEAWDFSLFCRSQSFC